MAIEPQVHLGQTDNMEFIANRKFTDRKEPRQAFDFQVQQIIEENLHNNPKHHVLVYYGIGGIGKSSLQRYFKSQLEKESKKCFYTFLDFSNTSFHHPNKAFLELINNIHCSYKFSFPHFWIAYAIYFKKLNPEMVYQDKKFLKSESWTILSDLLSLMDGAGLISVIPGMVNKAYDVLQNFKLDKKIKNDLKQLENSDVCTIEKKLPAFWAYDFKKNLEEFHPSSTVIFLDTYEALWCNGRNEMTKYSADSWIRELVSHLKGILFVICGREHLEWENIDKDWKDILDQHLLEHLSPSDVEAFLIECGICEDSIRQKMIAVSAGHPYHLDYISQLDYDAIHESSEYSRMYIRHIHNQMTYCNTIDLAQSLTTFIAVMKEDEFHELYVDALFTLATLQLASGNYRTCGESLIKAYKKAEEHSLMLLLCRILRKLTEYFMGQNDFNNAYKICKNGILISKRENFERYYLYLQCDMAEWYRKNHMFDKARNIYINCGKEFKAKGIKSWTGHVAIGIALVEYDKQNYERCLEYLTIASQIYTPLYHAWGLMQVDVINTKCNYRLNNFTDLDELELKIKHAHNMGYMREHEILKQLYQKNDPPWTLLFL